MLKLHLIAFAVGLLLTCRGAFAETLTNDAPLFATPDKQIGIIKKGSTVEVLNNSGEWRKVRFVSSEISIEGWIKMPGEGRRSYAQVVDASISRVSLRHYMESPISRIINVDIDFGYSVSTSLRKIPLPIPVIYMLFESPDGQRHWRMLMYDTTVLKNSSFKGWLAQNEGTVGKGFSFGRSFNISEHSKSAVSTDPRLFRTVHLRTEGRRANMPRIDNVELAATRAEIWIGGDLVAAYDSMSPSGYSTLGIPRDWHIFGRRPSEVVYTSGP